MKLKYNEIENKIKKIYLTERTKVDLEENWGKLTNNEKKIVVELYYLLNSNDTKIINEARWYNTILDFLGLLPVVGTPIDLYNGYSYWRQGDTLFAILSWISAVPLVGDVIGMSLKGVFNTFKLGGKGVSALKTAIATKDVAKIAEAAKVVGGPTVKVFEKFPLWGDKVLKMLEATVRYFPFLGRGFIKTVKSWLEIFGLVGKELKTFKSLSKMEVKRLMANTKWYAGWLDWYGIGDFKGSEAELRKLVPDLETKMGQYASTQESKNILAQSDTDVDYNSTEIPSITKMIDDDPIDNLVKILTDF